MSKVQVNQIRVMLQKLFTGQIQLSDLATRPQREQDDAFLSRSLAAYALVVSSDVPPDVAASHVVDGFDDNGIDAIHYDAAQRRLVLVQSKWMHDGNGSPQVGDVLKFVRGVNDLLKADFAAFNSRFALVRDEAWSFLQNEHARLVFILAYTGRQGLSRDAKREMQRLLKDVNDTSDVATFQAYSQRELHASIADRIEGTVINLPDLVMYEWGIVREPHRAFYGQVTASDVAAWYLRHGEKLFAKNIRKVITNSDVNEAIKDSLLREPSRFWYLNNGITVVCNTMDKKPVGGSERSSGSFACTGVSVVNGAQTVGAIAAAATQDERAIEQARVFVKFISAQNCPPDFVNDVTRAANTQNRIESKDFAALDPQQRRLYKELLLEGKEYAYRTGEKAPEPEQGCTIDDATIALACAHGDVSLAVIAKSAVGRFWSDTDRAPYTTLFNKALTAQRLWRAVEVLRAIDRELTVAKSSSVPKHALVALHGNRFVAHQVFKRLPANALQPAGSFDRALEQARRLTTVLVATTSSAVDEVATDAYLPMLFKNAERCKRIDEFLSSYLGTGSEESSHPGQLRLTGVDDPPPRRSAASS
jgi:hypothetical protein